MPSPRTITRLVNALSEGGVVDAEEARRLYMELKALAARHLQGDRGARELPPTELVHQAYLRLFGGSPSPWKNRAHFFGAAALAMQRILIDEARRRKLRERAVVVLGGMHGTGPVGVVREGETGASPTLDVVALGGALEALERIDPRAAQIVRFRVFMGLTVEQTAELLELSDRTVKRDWLVARTWLFQRIDGKKPPEGE